MKRFLFLLVAVLSANVVNAAYLYWQVQPSDFAGWGIKAADSAWVIAVDGSGTETVMTDIEGADMYEVPMNKQSTISLDGLTDVASYSFYIELMNYNEATEMYDVTGHSQTMTYSEMVAANYIDTGMTPVTPSAIWHGGTYEIPEPTSAMLVMMGMGLLALKRRKA